MKYERVIELSLVGTLLFLGFGVLNPYWMPMGLELLLLLILGVLFVSYATYVFRENDGDEREVAITHSADRLAFLSGMTLLIVATAYDFYITHYVDKWIVAAIIVMVLTKILATRYYRSR